MLSLSPKPPPTASSELLHHLWAHLHAKAVSTSSVPRVMKCCKLWNSGGLPKQHDAVKHSIPGSKRKHAHASPGRFSAESVEPTISFHVWLCGDGEGKWGNPLRSSRESGGSKLMSSSSEMRGPTNVYECVRFTRPRITKLKSPSPVSTTPSRNLPRILEKRLSQSAVEAAHGSLIWKTKRWMMWRCIGCGSTSNQNHLWRQQTFEQKLSNK